MNRHQLAHLLFKDIGLKALALALAVGTWVYVNQITAGDRENVRVLLTFKVPPDKFVLAPRWQELQLALRGPAAAVSQLRPEDLRAEIDILAKLRDQMPDTSNAPQRVSILIEPSDVSNLPGGVTVRRLQPSPITIILDEMAEKRLTVKEQLVGTVKTGFRIHQVYPTPRQVITRGPRSILARLDTVATDPIAIDGLDAEKWGPVRSLDRRALVDGHPVECLSHEPPQVQVLIELIRVSEKTTLKNIPIEVRGLPGLHYTVRTADNARPLAEVLELQVEAPEKLLPSAKVRLFVDLTDVRNPKEQPEVTRRVQLAPADPAIRLLSTLPEVVVQIRSENP